MAIHYSKRILCCLLALLVFCFCLMRPMVITANATAAGTAAMAGVVGIAPEIAIPAIIVLLGISVVAANWDDICDFTEGLFDDLFIQINGEDVIPAYDYNNQLYVSEDVVEATVYTLEDYFTEKYGEAWDIALGENLTYMFTSPQFGGNAKRVMTVFGETTPVLSQVGDDVKMTVQCPAVVHESLFGGIDSETYDLSGQTGEWSMTFFSTDVFTFDTSTIADLQLDSTLSIVNPDGEEEYCIPIAPSTSIPYELTDTKVTVFDDSATETVPGTSTVDLSGVIGWLKNIWQAITNIDLSQIKTYLSNISTKIGNLADSITAPIVETVTAVKTVVTNGVNYLSQVIQSVKVAISNGITTITDAISSSIDAIIEWLISIGASLSDILEWIKTLPASIAQAISGVLTDIFVPAEDYVTTKVEALTARFTWIEPIVVFCKDLASEFGSATPPVIYVHLEDAESDVNYGGTVKFLDMSWYARYKAQGDLIISGFLWAIFCWRMYVRLPGIINGVSGDIGQMTYGESRWQRAESRSKKKGGSGE